MATSWRTGNLSDDPMPRKKRGGARAPPRFNGIAPWSLLLAVLGRPRTVLLEHVEPAVAIGRIDPRRILDLVDTPDILDTAVADLELGPGAMVASGFHGVGGIADVDHHHAVGIPGDVGLVILDDNVVRRVGTARVAARVVWHRAAHGVES